MKRTQSRVKPRTKSQKNLRQMGGADWKSYGTREQRADGGIIREIMNVSNKKIYNIGLEPLRTYVNKRKYQFGNKTFSHYFNRKNDLDYYGRGKEYKLNEDRLREFLGYLKKSKWKYTDKEYAEITAKKAKLRTGRRSSRRGEGGGGGGKKSSGKTSRRTKKSRAGRRSSRKVKPTATIDILNSTPELSSAFYSPPKHVSTPETIRQFRAKYEEPLIAQLADSEIPSRQILPYVERVSKHTPYKPLPPAKMYPINDPRFLKDFVEETIAESIAGPTKCVAGESCVPYARNLVRGVKYAAKPIAKVPGWKRKAGKTIRKGIRGTKKFLVKNVLPTKLGDKINIGSSSSPAERVSGDSNKTPTMVVRTINGVQRRVPVGSIFVESTGEIFNNFGDFVSRHPPTDNRLIKYTRIRETEAEKRSRYLR